MAPVKGIDSKLLIKSLKSLLINHWGECIYSLQNIGAFLGKRDSI